jgi:tetratricopeptide (TPR) repeat protein
MAKILSFPGASVPDPEDEQRGEDSTPQAAGDRAQRKPPKFGFTRVRRSPKASGDQLDLFAAATAAGAGKLLAFPGATSAFEQGLLDDEAGNGPAARAGYEAAIAAGDSVADAYCNLGILEYAAGGTDAAFDCFRQALKHEQGHWESHYNLGNLYFDAGQYGPSRVHYEVAAEIEPEFRNVHFNLTLALAMQADYAAAVASLERFRELAPEDEAEAAAELLDTLRASQAHMEARRSPDR